MKKYLTLKNLGLLVLFFAVFLLVNSGLDKILGTPEMIQGFEFFKMPQYRIWVGIGELVAAGLLIYPKTMCYGATLVTCFMSGALTIHLSYMGGQGAVFPVLVGVLAWASYYLRGGASVCCTKTCNKQK